MESSEGMTSSTRSFAYSYRLVKKCFLKICETSKCHNFLIFQPIFIRFSLFCSENFTLSSEIKLEQLRTSPLSFFLNIGIAVHRLSTQWAKPWFQKAYTWAFSFIELRSFQDDISHEIFHTSSKEHYQS